jgi:hypothetical protein
MEYTDHDSPRAGTASALWVHHESADSVRYADSGSFPDDSLSPSDALRPLGKPHQEDGLHAADMPRQGGDPHVIDASHRSGALWSESALSPTALRPDGGPLPDGGRGRGPGAGLRADAETGTYPVLDRYAGYERFAGEPSAQPEAAGERPFTRVYARPADPRRARLPGDDDQRRTGRRGQPPAGRYPAESARAGYPAELPRPDCPAVGYPAAAGLGSRLAGLRADRWIIAGGSLAATVAVVVAFATAGGSATAHPATTRTAATHVTQPACVSSAPRR